MGDLLHPCHLGLVSFDGDDHPVGLLFLLYYIGNSGIMSSCADVAIVSLVYLIAVPLSLVSLFVTAL